MTGHTQGPSGSEAVYTKQARIAELARQLAGRRLESLNHYLDLAWMQEACRRTRKDGAAGVDGVTWEQYSHELPRRLADLLDPAPGMEGTIQAVCTAFEQVFDCKLVEMGMEPAQSKCE